MDANNFTLTFRDISYSVRSGIPFIKNESRKILNNISGEFRKSELTAIIGLSGSGKSSLLNCLTGFKRTNFTGTIMINESEINSERIKQFSSYVMQEPSLHLLLTISEVMKLSLNLKNKQMLNKSEKELKIKRILDELGIDDRRDTLIRDLSGGERKRFQIAVEILHDPKILFLDECTTGLDNVSATQCIKMLKNLAIKGTTVICTIHQPSALMLRTFDHIYALADGNCIYQGTSAKLVPFLYKLELICPSTYNPTDFLLEIANNDYGQQNHRLTESIENGRNEDYRREITNGDKNNNNTKRNNELFNDLTKKPTKYSVSFLWQVFYLMHRIFLLTLRDKSLLYMRLAIHLVLGIVFGHIYDDVGSKGSAMLDNYRYLVVSVVFLLYTSYHSKYVHFPIEYPIIKCEHFNGWYSTSAYYSSFILFDIPITTFCCTAYVTITYFMTNQPHELYRYLIFLGFTIVMSFAAQILAIMVTTLMNIKMAAIFGTMFITPFFLFSSVMIVSKDVNPFFRIFFDGNFLDLALKGVLNSVLGFNRTKLDCDEMYCHFADPKKFIRDFEINVNMKGAFAIIILYILICQIVSFILIRYRLKHSQT